MDLGTVAAVLAPRERSELAGFGAQDAFLAGGSWLFSEPQPHLRRLFDLSALGWPALEASEDGLEIAATCTLAELAALAVPERWPALALARRCCHALRGSFKVWNVATVGGNLCCGLPAGPMISLTSALDGECLIWAPDGGQRTLAVLDFVTGDGGTALRPGELLRSVRVPDASLRAPVAMRQLSLFPLGRSAVLLIGRLDPGGGLELTVTASTARPVRLSFPGAAPSAERLREAIDERLGPDAYLDDIHGSGPWRRHLTHSLAEEIRTEIAGGGPA